MTKLRKSGGRQFICCLAAILLMTVLFSTAVFAEGDVAGAIQSTWDAAKVQIKSVVNNVVFPVCDLVLAVLFFVKLGTCFFEYRRHGQFDFTPTAILFASLIFMLTAPLYVWGIIGM